MTHVVGDHGTCVMDAMPCKHNYLCILRRSNAQTGIYYTDGFGIFHWCVVACRSSAQLVGKMGVTRETITPGDGTNFPQVGDELTMHYTGTLVSDQSKFDSSVDKGRPFVFKIGLGMVIKGWDEGVIAMSLGEKAVLTITSDFGYGERGAGGVIPPNADLRFEVELLAIGALRAPSFRTSVCSSCSLQ